MATLMVFHEVEDVDKWAASEKRAEFFASLGMTIRIFRDPEGSNRVGVLVDSADLAVLQEALQTEEAAAAMKNDGVKPETVVALVEA